MNHSMPPHLEHPMVHSGLWPIVSSARRSSIRSGSLFLVVLSLLFASASLLRAQSEPSPDADGYVHTNFESYISASLNAPNGASDLSSGTLVSLNLAVTRHGREVWNHPDTGDTRIKNEASEAVDSGQFSVAVLQGDGSLSTFYGYTDSTGNASFSYTMGSSDTQLEVVVQDINSAVGSAFITLSAPPPPPEPGDPPLEPETWTFSHSEGLLHAALGTSGGTTSVPTGTETPVTVYVTYETWDVEVSSYQNTRTTNYSTSAAVGATVNWWTENSGTIYPGGYTTMWDGTASCTFSMGSTDSTVHAHVSYGGSDSAVGTLSFTAPASPSSSYSHTGITYSVTFDTAIIENLSPGNTGAASGTLTYTNDEVWIDAQGNPYVAASFGPYPSSGQTIQLSSTADLQLSSTTVTTDANGLFSVPFTVGSENSAILASPASDETVQGTVNVNPLGTPPPAEPYLVGTDSGYSLVFTGGDVQSVEVGQPLGLSGQLRYWSRDVMTDGVTPWYDNESEIDAADTALQFSIISGSGTLSQSGVMTDSNGNFSTDLTGSVVNNEVVVTAGLASANGSEPLGQVTVSVYPAAEVWTNVGDPYTKVILTAFADGYEGAFQSQALIAATLMEESWIQQESSYGGTREISLVDNETYFATPLQGASVSFQIPNGSSGQVTATATTDEYGNTGATYTYGVSGGVVAVYAYGETQTIGFTTTDEGWSEWEQTATVGVTITPLTNGADLQPGQTCQLRAHITYESNSQRTHSSGVVQENFSSSPAQNAPVSLQVLAPEGGTLVPAGGSLLTNLNGDITLTYTRGAAASSNVKVSTSFLGATSYATHAFHSGWLKTESDANLVVSFQPAPFPAKSLQTLAQLHSWDVVEKNGQTATCNLCVSPAIDATVAVQVVSGMASIWNGSSMSDLDGKALTRVAALENAVLETQVSFQGRTTAVQYTVPSGAGDVDDDGDGLTNAIELAGGTNPFRRDTDGDGVADHHEIAEGTNPNDAASSSLALVGLKVLTRLQY